LAVRPAKAAKLLDVSPRKMDRLISEGVVEAAREGRTVLVVFASLERLLQLHRITPCRKIKAAAVPGRADDREPKGRPRKSPAVGENRSPSTLSTAAI